MTFATVTFSKRDAEAFGCPNVQVDQGFGLGNGAPIFNRHQVSCTRFLQLPILRPIPGSTAPPASLILHGRYGGCIGDLASYDCFTLGGPHSVRGFNVGELATCRRFLEGSAEVRLPVLNRQVSPVHLHPVCDTYFHLLSTSFSIFSWTAPVLTASIACAILWGERDFLTGRGLLSLF